MVIAISSKLTEPPSNLTCFRDVTLYAKCFLNSEILLECPPEKQDLYWKWLKKRGAWDFIDDIVERKSELVFSIRRKEGNITVPYINYNNLNFILVTLKQFAGHR